MVHTLSCQSRAIVQAGLRTLDNFYVSEQTLPWLCVDFSTVYALDD